MAPSGFPGQLSWLKPLPNSSRIPQLSNPTCVTPTVSAVGQTRGCAAACHGSAHPTTGICYCRVFTILTNIRFALWSYSSETGDEGKNAACSPNTSMKLGCVGVGQVCAQCALLSTLLLV